jgi:hypothetical protein
VYHSAVVCTPCLANCNQCNSPDKCTTCAPRYGLYINESMCVPLDVPDRSTTISCAAATMATNATLECRLTPRRFSYPVFAHATRFATSITIVATTDPAQRAYDDSGGTAFGLLTVSIAPNASVGTKVAAFYNFTLASNWLSGFYKVSSGLVGSYGAMQIEVLAEPDLTSVLDWCV